MKKQLVCPERLRRVPSQFSWIDQRLFRGARTASCDAQALALYLFLVTVADAQGLSFYSDASIARVLRWETLQLAAARQRLVQADLIAHRPPLYQGLSLDPIAPPGERLGTAVSVGEILRRALAPEGGTP